ncbi:MAG: helix-turn-helix transcriptional regulator [Terracidiphilus sp.]|jgi:DNA-binding PadR family transcriptional regulator
MDTKTHRSPLGLILLSLLHLEPTHAYRMQKLLVQWGKDRVVNVRQRASVYQTLDRLVRLRLIEVKETVKTESHPDRILYAITPRGREKARLWLGEMLTTVGAEFPEFPAAVSVLTMLPAEEVRRDFEIRAAALRQELGRLDEERRQAGKLPRLFLLENGYRTALIGAELGWLEAAISDFDSGVLGWDAKWLRDVADQLTPE